jgi:hypothetical protein
MVRDSDTSAMKFSNGMSSPPWPSGAGEVQNGGCLGLLKLDVGGGGGHWLQNSSRQRNMSKRVS